MEKILGNELRRSDAQIIDNGPGRYRVKIDFKHIYRLLRNLRVAERVLLEFVAFKATSFDQFYQGVRNAAWRQLFPADCRIHMDKVRLHRCTLNSVSSIQSMTQKAMYDTLCKAWKQERMSETGPQTIVRVYGEDDYFRICVDLSGDALHKRGYRQKSGRAPLKETIAAGMLLLNSWKRKTPLFDPFCGSGTFLFEALSYAGNIAPNLYRAMGIQNLCCYRSEDDAHTIQELAAGIRFDTIVRLRGSDKEAAMINICEKNLESFVDCYRLNDEGRQWAAKSVSFSKALMEDATRYDAQGLIIANPPYGERLEDAQKVQVINQSIGGLYRTFYDWALCCITSTPDFELAIDAKPAMKRPVHNGASEAFIYRFDPFEPATETTSGE